MTHMYCLILLLIQLYNEEVLDLFDTTRDMEMRKQKSHIKNPRGRQRQHLHCRRDNTHGLLRGRSESQPALFQDIASVCYA